MNSRQISKRRIEPVNQLCFHSLKRQKDAVFWIKVLPDKLRKYTISIIIKIFLSFRYLGEGILFLISYKIIENEK